MGSEGRTLLACTNIFCVSELASLMALKTVHSPIRDGTSNFALSRLILKCLAAYGVGIGIFQRPSNPDHFGSDGPVAFNALKGSFP